MRKHEAHSVHAEKGEKQQPDIVTEERKAITSNIHRTESKHVKEGKGFVSGGCKGAWLPVSGDVDLVDDGAVVLCTPVSKDDEAAASVEDDEDREKNRGKDTGKGKDKKQRVLSPPSRAWLFSLAASAASVV